MRNKFLFPCRMGIAVIAGGMLLFGAAAAGARETEDLEPAQTVQETEAPAADGPAITIDGTDYTLAQFNYYFQSWYDSFSTENASMLPYMFDTSVSLKEQEYEKGRSWFDYFVDEACASMQQIITLAEEARRADYTLPARADEEIGRVLDTVTEFADTLGMEADDYLAYFYGEGMDREAFAACLADARLADGYAQQVREAFEISGEQLEAYYAQHARDFTTVNYERYFAKAGAMGTQPAKEQMDKAKAVADAVFEKVQGGVSLQEASAGLEEEGTYHSFEDAQYIAGSVYGDWLFDPERKNGDVLEVEETNGWYVMVFHERALSDYSSVSVLDAFFPVDPADGSMDEQLEASCLKAEDFLKEWQESDADEAAFEKMASKQAEQSGAAYAYPSLTKDRFSGNLNKWAFGSERKSGDVAVLYDPDGFHVMYYIGESVPAWQVMAENALREEAFSDWFDALMEGSELIRHEEVLAHAGGY